MQDGGVHGGRSQLDEQRVQRERARDEAARWSSGYAERGELASMEGTTAEELREEVREEGRERRVRLHSRDPLRPLPRPLIGLGLPTVHHTGPAASAASHLRPALLSCRPSSPLPTLALLQWLSRDAGQCTAADGGRYSAAESPLIEVPFGRLSLFPLPASLPPSLLCCCCLHHSGSHYACCSCCGR